MLKTPEDARLRILRRGIRAIFRLTDWTSGGDRDFSVLHPDWIDDDQVKLDHQDLDQILVSIPACEEARSIRAINRFQDGDWLGCVADAEVLLSYLPMNRLALNLLMSASLKLLEGREFLELAAKWADRCGDDLGEIMVVRRLDVTQEGEVVVGCKTKLRSEGIGQTTAGQEIPRYDVLLTTGSYAEAVKAMGEYSAAANGEKDRDNSCTNIALLFPKFL